MDTIRKREYLQAMGIEQWVERTAQTEPDAQPQLQPEPATIAATAAVEPPPAAPVATAGSEPGSHPEMPAWLDEGPPSSDEGVPPGPQDEAEDDAPPRDPLAGLDWKALAYRVSQCEACELHKGRKNSVFGVGDQAANLMVIGEAPGAEEDRQGEPFVGPAGQLLNAMLLAIGLQREQVFIANILKCRPPGNRDPRVEEALRCEPYLQRQIALVQPKVILAVGRVAAQNLLKSQEPVGRLRASREQYRGIPLVVTYHPAYLLRSPDQKGKVWQDLQRAANLLR